MLQYQRNADGASAGTEWAGSSMVFGEEEAPAYDHLNVSFRWYFVAFRIEAHKYVDTWFRTG